MPLAPTIGPFKQRISNKDLLVSRGYWSGPRKRVQPNKNICEFRRLRQFQKQFLSRAKSCIIAHIRKNKPRLHILKKSNIDNNNALDQLCIVCVENKLTHVVRKNKTMTLIINKLEKVHTNLWGSHDLFSQFRSSYAAILICKHI